jgi:uncharacterized protein
MTAAALKARTLKDLAQLAKRSGVSGWNTMRKEELVKAILRHSSKPKPVAAAKTASNKAASKPIKAVLPVKATSNGKHLNGSKNGHDKVLNGKTITVNTKVIAKPAPHTPLTPPKPVKAVIAPVAKPTPMTEQRKKVIRKLEEIKQQAWGDKNLAPAVAAKPVPVEIPLSKPVAIKPNWPAKDRLVVMVRGPYWLHATWNLTPAGVQRAQAALAQDWHLAKPILRVINITTSGSSTSSEQIVREIPIHGGVKNWFIDVNNPPQSYRVEIGYLSNRGRFFCMARSNTVTTPPPQIGDSLETHWADIAQDCEKIYALSGGNGEAISDLQDLFAEKVQKPLAGINLQQQSDPVADAVAAKGKNFKLEVDAEVVLRGRAALGSTVTVQGEPIKVHSDGSFSVSMDFPNRRQVIPIVANTKDGELQRTVVVAVERNTKAMEPHPRDQQQE